MGLLGLLNSNTRAPDCRPASMKRSGTSAKFSSCSGTGITSAAHRCPNATKRSYDGDGISKRCCSSNNRAKKSQTTASPDPLYTMK